MNKGIPEKTTKFLRNENRGTSNSIVFINVCVKLTISIEADKHQTLIERTIELKKNDSISRIIMNAN